MDIHLNPLSEELVKRQLAKGEFGSPEEVIESALRAFAEKGESGAQGAAQRRAVEGMIEFVRRNRVRLESGVSVKDLIREGRRV